MAAQVEVQTGEVGRTGVGGRLHLSPLTDSSNKSLTEGPSSIHGSRIIPPEPSKPAPSPKPRLTPKPFAVEKNPTIRPILAPKPHPKPRPESTQPLSYKPDPPSTPKPPQPNEGVASKPRPVSTSSSRPAPTSFKPSPKLNTGQTSKPVAQPFKPAPPLPVGDSSKPTPPKPAERQKPIAVGASFLRSSTKPPAAEWSGSTKKEAEKDMGSGRRLGVSAMSRAKSMDFLSQIGQADKVMKEEEKKVTSAVALRPQSKGSRPRPVSAIFLPSPTQTESSAPSPPWAVRRPLSADLTSRFESIGLSLHRKPPNTDSKENTPEEGAPLRRREREKAPEMTLFIPPGSDGGAAKPAVSDPGNERGKEGAEKVEEKSGGSSIKRRISLLLDSSSPVMGVTGQGPEPRSPVQPIPEAEVPVAGVKQRIRQLTVDTPPTQNPVVKPTPRPRPLPLDLTKRFTPERSTDLGSPSPIEATDHHDSASDPQSRIETSAASSSDQTKMTEDNIRAQEQLTVPSPSPVAGTSDEGQSMGSVSKERESGSEVQTVRASLFENVVERHSVQVLDDDLPKAKGDALPSSPSIEQIDKEDDGTLVTATYREPVSPSSPMRVMHSFDTVPAVEGSRAVSESVPSAYLEDKAMTLRSRRSEGNRPPAVDRTPPVQGDTGLAPTPGQQPPRYLRVGALPKWDASGPEQEVDMEKGRQRELEKERQLALERQREAERQRDAEREEAAAAPKRLKMLEADEQPKPRATYFALTGQIQEPASPADAGNTPGPFDDVSVRSGQWGSQGKIVPFRRNSSLEEAFGKSLQIPYQVEEPMERSQVSETERGSVRDKHTAGEAMEVEKQRDPRSETDRQREKKELEREKQRQVDIERQKHLEFARMKERERQREFERQRQKEYEKEKQMELERRKNLEIEKERQRELERTQQLEKDRQWELERQKQIEIEKEKRQDLERERQLQLEKERQLQLEKERQRDLERQKLLEMETRRQQEVERERRREQENERLRQQEKERQLQMEKERQLQLEKERQRDLERQKLLEMETRRQQEVERERRREQENERLRQLEKERQLQLEKERQRDLERQKLLEMETRRQQELERERQREQESERQRQLEKERQQLEKERQWELERERQREAERERRELDRQREMEKETQRELERQQELEKDRLREMEKEKQREMEKERQREMEKERQREIERQRELEKERRRELEKERQREMEKERQRELEKEKNREVERQRELDKERQLLEMQKERQRLEALERVKEMERRQLQEFERQKMEMEHRQQELEKQRLEEKMEKEEADKLRLVALQMEAEKMREAEQERVKELEKEQLRELERQRQRDLERQKKLDFERREMENQKMRELEKERRQKEELERLKEMERRQLLEFEKQKQQKAEKERMQLAELEKHRLRERMAREEAEKMRQVAKQQEAERQRIKEKQRREEQERADPSPLRPKVLDLDSVLKEDQRSKASSHHGDPATRWKLPSPRTDEPYKPVHLDIDSFTSQTQHSPSREVFPVAGIQDVDASGGVKVLPPTPERGNKAAPEAVAVRSRLSSQDPWELNPGEMSVDRPVAAPEPPKKPANKPSLEQLLLKHEERHQTPERRWSAMADEPPHASRDPIRAGSPGRAPFSNSNPMELVRAPKESELKGRSGNARGQRRSQGSQELNRMRSRSVSRRSMPSESAMEGSLSRMRSRSAHRERDQQTWVQQKQSGSGEDEGKDTDTLVHETDSQYGTWETGLHTDDSLTPATPSSESNPSPSPRKPTPPQTPEDPAPSIHSDTPDGLSAPSEIEPLNFPEAPATLLDTSALRSRAQLGKKRAPRSRPSRAARQNTALTAPPEGQAGATEDWRYRDSTEDKVENKQEESDSEEQARGADSRSAASSQPQRVALFPGMMDPSALKAQLKKRGEPEGQLDVPAPSQLSRSPKSPFLPRAARVLPPSGGKENGEEESPQWLRELKSKKRLSQYDNDS